MKDSESNGGKVEKTHHDAHPYQLLLPYRFLAFSFAISMVVGFALGRIVFVENHLRRRNEATMNWTAFQQTDVCRTSPPNRRTEQWLKYRSRRPEIRKDVDDKSTRSSKFDSAVYLEALVHPAMFTHDNPRRVAIAGSGQSATLLEVLKHNTVEKVVVLVDASRTNLSEQNDCSNLDGIDSPFFDSSIIDVSFETSVARFMDHFKDDIENVDRTSQQAAFDVIIMDTLDPITFDNQDYLDTLANALGDEGILVVEFDDMFDVSSLASFIDGLEKAGFESIVEYDEGTGGIWSFFVAMKDESNRANWIRNEAETSVEIQERTTKTLTGGFPFKHFDGATMMSYQFPSRIVEENWCRRPERCEDGGHGFDPWIENTPITSLEAKPSTIPHGGRGLFAKVDLKKGSYTALEDSVHGMLVLPYAYWLLDTSFLAFDFDYYETFMTGYVEGYGFHDSNYGELAAGVDTGITTFVNHGCHGDYNVGEYLPVHESTPGIENGLESFISDYVPKTFDPRAERRFPNWECDNDKVLRDIEAGEELFENYLTYGGATNLQSWKDNLKELRAVCAGEDGGIVTQYEEA